jgi:hypothetical protein
MRGIVLPAGALAAGFASAAGSQDVDVTVLQMKAYTLIKDDATRVPVANPSGWRVSANRAMLLSDVGRL